MIFLNGDFLVEKGKQGYHLPLAKNKFMNPITPSQPLHLVCLGEGGTDARLDVFYNKTKQNKFCFTCGGKKRS